MQLSHILRKDSIIFPVNSSSKTDVVQELLNLLLNQKYLTGIVKLFSFIDDHDKLMNSATGRGIAFHYSSSIEVKKPVAVFGISKTGINYDAPDGQKVHFIFLSTPTIFFRLGDSSHRKWGW